MKLLCRIFGHDTRIVSTIEEEMRTKTTTRLCYRCDYQIVYNLLVVDK